MGGQGTRETYVALFPSSLAMYSFLVTEMSGNYSSVDRLWSVLPVLYTWHFYVHGAGDTRTLAMALLATVWGLRLSYNFWRKGGYSGEEDYRWPVLREIIGSDWRFTVFNLTFISTYQHLLLLAFVLPAYVSSECPGTPWGLLDYAAMALFLGLVVLETVADEQQWNFQQTKKQLANKDAKREGDFKLGFLTTGLFSLSRHPNFFAEQSIWWSFYLFAVSSSGVWLHWSVMGTVLLTLLFQGSTPFTESITKKRHPAYARYQKTTSRLVPWLPGPRLN